MISLGVIFWIMVIFFGLIGYMRGWQKEVIALSGLVGATAALQQFGYQMVSLLGAVIPEPATQEQIVSIRRQQFWIQAIFLLVIAFFSYQVVARVAESVAGGRFGERLRAGLERRIVGMIVGAVNGYLLIGGLWSLLEYSPTPEGYVQLLPGVTYSFAGTLITRPELGTAAATVSQFLPLGIFSPTIWLIFFFVTFFIVIVALI